MVPRGISHCFFCGAAGPAGSGCASCLVPRPRFRSDGTAACACARCATPMLTLGIAPLATVHGCATCHGLFVGARAWSALVAQPELASELAKKLPVLATPPARLVQLLQCPTCAHQMDRGRFGASSSIVIDVCLAHGVWLDGGEVVAIAALAAKRAAEGAPSIPAEDPNVEAERSERALVKERSAKREKLAKQIGVSVLIAAAVFKFLLLVLSKD